MEHGDYFEVSCAPGFRYITGTVGVCGIFAHDILGATNLLTTTRTVLEHLQHLQVVSGLLISLHIHACRPRQLWQHRLS